MPTAPLPIPSLWPTAGRALLVALVSLGAARCIIQARLLEANGGRRQVAWICLLAPFFAPALLVGYAFAPLAQMLVRAPTAQTALYAWLLWTRLLPVAVIALLLAPSALTPQGEHCAHLLPHRAAQKRIVAWRLRWRAAGPAPFVALASVFLLAFGEFELASLVGVKTWTVAIFNAQAGGLAPGAALRLAAAPALLQAAALGSVLGLLALPSKSNERRPILHQAEKPSGKKSARLSAWLLLGASAIIGAALPVALLAFGAWRGLARLTEHPALAQEIATSAGFAALAACCAGWLAAAFWQRRARCRWCGFVLAAPAMGGTLLLALGVLTLFQATLTLGQLYDSPLPLLLALTWMLLPPALLFTALRQATRPAEALHVAQLAGSPPALFWQLEGRTRAGVVFALFCLAYFDLTCSSLLAPTGLPPVFVRLYNLAHYGHSAVLSAMLLLAYLAPGCVGLLGAFVCQHVALLRSDR